MYKKYLPGFGALVAAVALLGTAVEAAIVTVPTGLSPGAKYRLVFVTSTKRDATSSNIADYNAFVTSTAEAVPALLALGTTWTAIGSTATVDARDNTGTNPSGLGVPVYILNGSKVANDNADLWDGSIQDTVRITELDGLWRDWVWTGSTSAGTAHSTSPLGHDPCAAGDSGSSVGPIISRPIYALSGVVTVPQTGTVVVVR